MKRRTKKSRRIYQKRQRETRRFTKRSPLLSRTEIRNRDYTIYEDHRLFRPDPLSYKRVDDMPTVYRENVSRQNLFETLYPQVGFKNPYNQIVCKRRRDRRQSLFALKRAGKGIKVSKKRKYTDKSKVRC